MKGTGSRPHEFATSIGVGPVCHADVQADMELIASFENGPNLL
jgi:hypothetical protein